MSAAHSLPSEFQALIGGTPLDACFAFWRARRNGRTAPPKAAMDPVEMPLQILPFLFLYEREQTGRFRCRLAGTGLCAAFQRDPTGRYLDEMIMPNARAERLALFNGVVDRSLPVAYAGNVAEADRTWVKFRRVMMPIAIRGEAADGLFGMVIFPDFEIRKSSPKLVDGGRTETVAWATPADL